MTKRTRKTTKKKVAETKPATTVSQPSKAKQPSGSSRSLLAGIAEGFLEHLAEAGKTQSTIASYRADLGIAMRHFGPETSAAKITKKQVLAFNDSSAVTKTRTGKSKAMPGVEKTRRVLRLALDWAVANGRIAKSPAAKS